MRNLLQGKKCIMKLLRHGSRDIYSLCIFTKIYIYASLCVSFFWCPTMAILHGFQRKKHARVIVVNKKVSAYVIQTILLICERIIRARRCFGCPERSYKPHEKVWFLKP